MVPSVAGLGPVPNTRAALGGYVDALTRVDSQLTEIHAALTKTLTDRDAAAALLSALQAKAAALGYATDPQLVAMVPAIQSSLAATPVVLPVTQQLLAAFSAQLDYLSRETR